MFPAGFVKRTIATVFGLLVLSIECNTTHKRNGALVSSSIGEARVINKCAFEIQSNVVLGVKPKNIDGPLEFITTIGLNETASQSFLIAADIGIAWKLARWLDDGKLSGPIQLEWTWATDQALTYWDLSMIDAGSYDVGLHTRHESNTDRVHYAFAESGLTISPMLNGEDVGRNDSSCRRVECVAGKSTCRSVYNWPEDWKRQRACDEEVDLVLTLCG